MTRALWLLRSDRGRGLSHGRGSVDRVARDSDDLVDLAADAGRARAPWFQEFTTEAHIVVSGTWPVGYYPDGPEEFTGVRCDLDDHGVVERHFPRMAALRRDRPEIGRPELR
jgi:hypothetical protein